jgi:hypothetical protein
MRAHVVCSTRHGAAPTRASPARRVCMWTPCGPGGAGSPKRACPGWPTARAPVDRPRSPHCGPPRSRRWPANCPPRPASRWRAGVPEFAREAIQRGIAPAVSASTVRRWLDQDASSPGSAAPGSSSPNPTSKPRPSVCWTCTRARQGRPLDADEYVISADEKTSIQARCRCHPTLAPGTDRVPHSRGSCGGLLEGVPDHEVGCRGDAGHERPALPLAAFTIRERVSSARSHWWTVRGSGPALGRIGSPAGSEPHEPEHEQR